VIIEDRIRESEAGRKPGIHSFRAANGLAQFLPSALAHPCGMAKRELTMRPASASRLPRAHLAKGPSALRRTTRGICSAISNRELELLEPSLTHRKQTTAPNSNRELPTKRNSQSSQVLSPLPPQIRKWSRPLLPGSAQNVESDVTSTKQTTEDFLPGARTPARQTRFAQHPDASPLGFPK
jgi:hypothetical protein